VASFVTKLLVNTLCTVASRHKKLAERFPPLDPALVAVLPDRLGSVIAVADLTYTIRSIRSVGPESAKDFLGAISPLFFSSLSFSEE
jgi:hypothetical protein